MLFNPRAERWSTHFELAGAEIIPLTPVGKPDKRAIRAGYWAKADRQVG